MKTRRPFAALALASVVGVVVGERWGTVLPQAAWWTLTAGLLLAAFSLRRSVVCLLAVTAAFAVIRQVDGRWSGGAALDRSLGSERQLARIEGVVVGSVRSFEPERPRQQPFHMFRVRAAQIRVGDTLWRGDVMLSVKLSGPTPVPGSRITAEGTLERPAGARNPGEFDRAKWQRLHGLYWDLDVRSPGDWKVERAAGRWSGWRGVVDRVRAGIGVAVTAGLEQDPDAAAVVNGMVLGADQDTPDDIREIFRRSGTAHLLSVSGLHVAMFAVLVWGILGTLGVGPRAAMLLLGPAVLFYAALTGFQPAALRAAVMMLVGLGGLVIERKASILNSLSAAAFLLIASNTALVFEPGFQFSFLVVLAILWLAPKFQALLGNPLAPDAFLPEPLWRIDQRCMRSLGAWGCGAAAVSSAAWLGSIPCSIVHFNMVTPISILANVFIIPPSFAVLALGLLSALAWPVLPAVSVLLNYANLICCRIILGLASLAGSVPGGNFHPDSGSPTDWSLEVLDVGAGGSCLFRSGDRNWLLDTGSQSDARKIVSPALAKFGVDRLDGLLLTHGDARHLGGAVDIARRFRPHWAGVSALPDRSPNRRAFEQDWTSSGHEVVPVAAGGNVEISREATLRFLLPEAQTTGRLSDDKAVVSLIEVSGWRLLFLSDIGVRGLLALRAAEPDLRVDVVIQGAHSEDGRADPGTLTALGAKVIISTFADFPEQQMLTPEWESQLPAGVHSISLGDTGALTVRPVQGDLEFVPYLEGPTIRVQSDKH